MYEWKTAQNAIYLDDEVAGKGRQFKCRFLVPGLVKYDFGVCLLTKENADKFIQGFVGCPVIINHQELNDKNAKEKSVGNIFSVWFDDKDGYYWCNGIITDKHAIELIDKGYSVSCQYTITDYSDNTTGALHNGNSYDKMIEDGKPEHLAIVNNPRYEGAIIAVNAILAQNEDQWITIKPNGEEAKGRHLLIKEGETVHEAMERTYGIDGAKGQQKLFDTSKDRKTKEDYKREADEKQKKADEHAKQVQKRYDNLEYLGVAEPDKLDDVEGEEMSYEKWESQKQSDTKEDKKETYYESDMEEKINKFAKQYSNIDTSSSDFLEKVQKYFSNEAESMGDGEYFNEIIKPIKRKIKVTKQEDKKEPDKEEKKEEKGEPKELNKQTLGAIYKGKTWREIFEKRLDSKESKSWWIEKVNKPGEGLLADDVFSHYQLKSEEGYKTKIPSELNDYIKEKFDTSEKYIYNPKKNEKNKASNSFIETFKDTLYTALAEGIANRLGELIASNEDKWITIHPHGKESDDYRRLKIKDGETVEDAMHRQGYYNKRQAKDEKKAKEEKLSNQNNFKNKVTSIQNEIKELDNKTEEIEKKLSVHRRNIYQMYEDSFTREEADKKKEKYLQENSKELDKLAQEENQIQEKRNKKHKELDKILELEVETVLNTEIEGLDKDSLDKLMQKSKELFRMPIIYPLQLKLQQKILDIQEKISGLKYQSTHKKITEIAGVKKGKPMTFKEADSGKVNPNYGKEVPGLSFRKNCQSCVVCYQLRRNGFNVQTKGIPVDAKGNIIQSGKMYELAQHPEKAWINPKTGLPPELNICDATTPQKAYNWLNDNVKDGTYSFRIVWKGGKKPSGHIVIAHKENGNLKVYDTQTNKEYNSQAEITSKFFDNCRLRTKEKAYKPFIYRTDNLDVNKDYADAIMEKP